MPIELNLYKYLCSFMSGLCGSLYPTLNLLIHSVLSILISFFKNIITFKSLDYFLTMILLS